MPNDVRKDLLIRNAFDMAIDKDEKHLFITSDKLNKIHKVNLQSGDIKECAHKSLNKPMGITVKDDIL